jgi:tRNA(Arg) A34 adenosine deaminase TadA
MSLLNDNRSSNGMSEESVTEQDLAFLRRAIDLAREARAHGAHPFGALIVNEHGEILVTARNNAVRPKGDPTQHAERLACAKAGKLFDPEVLAKSTLYTSTEPCAMCAGAIYWTGIGRVVYALSEKRLFEFTGNSAENPTLDIPCREIFARGQKPTIIHGPLIEDEAAQAHEFFWKK